jgi:serine-type D-Ala-D-Ala carboxypeptidase/endopeptidase
MKSWCLQTVLSVVQLLALWPAFVEAAESIEEQIDPLVEAYLNNDQLVGLSVGVIRGDEVFTKGYGTTDKESSVVPDSGTVYEIGSITKTFTGILFADAIQSGQMSLDQPLQEALPSDIKLKVFHQQPIFLRHLSTHTSGLPRLPTNFLPKDPKNPYVDYSIDRMKAFLRNYQPKRAPQTKIDYSNLGMGLLGWVVAEKSKLPYQELVRQKVLLPLGMNRTSVELTSEMQQRYATPYDEAGQKTSAWEMPSLPGLGGLRSTVDDMLRYAQANLKPPSNALGEAIELAWTRHQLPLEENDFSMGLAWQIARDGTTRFHAGGTGGFSSAIFLHRPTQMAVVVLGNKANPETGALAESIIQKLFGMKIEPRRFEKSLVVEASILDSYVGEYEFVPGLVLTVRRKEKELWVQLTGQPEIQLAANSKTAWKVRGVEAVLTFSVDHDGKCNEVDLFQNNVHQTARRKLD